MGTDLKQIKINKIVQINQIDQLDKINPKYIITEINQTNKIKSSVNRWTDQLIVRSLIKLVNQRPINQSIKNQTLDLSINQSINHQIIVNQSINQLTEQLD